MKIRPDDLDRLSKDDLKALVLRLLAEIEALKDEVARLKGQPGRPKLPPSRMEDGTDDDSRRPGDKRTSKGARRPHNGGPGRSVRTAELTVHEEKLLTPPDLPSGSWLKDRKRYVVQDLDLHAHVIRYHRERYHTPDGRLLVAPLPDGISGHYGPNLVRFALQQYYECDVTMPKLLGQLHAFGIKISMAELSTLLTENKEPFHAEKQALFTAGLATTSAVTVDDTGARHQGRNGITTQIGDERFTVFETTETKSRINFLKMILLAGVFGYRINAAAAAWWRDHGVGADIVARLIGHATTAFATEADWHAHLAELTIPGAPTRRVLTEGALWGAIDEQGLLEGVVIVSDGAPQFAVGDHARCWIHGERQVQQIICATDEQRQEIDRTRMRIWNLYRSLKRYKKAPTPADKRRLTAWFDRIFNRTTGFAALDAVLDALYRKKAVFLRVLDRPDVPLHTNGSETDIRMRVEKRKISGGTRGNQGRRCQDTFASLIKTSRKLGITFWDFLGSRLGIAGRVIPPLADLIRATGARAATPT